MERKRRSGSSDLLYPGLVCLYDGVWIEFESLLEIQGRLLMDFKKSPEYLF